MDVESIAANESVLFLWCPNSILQDALDLLWAWGFVYRTNMVWVKDKSPAMGWYVDSRHEMLLIATRGIGMADSVLIKPPSWFSAPLEGRHSEKPKRVYDLIEAMFEGPYIELFAREQHEGWEAWGDEV